MTHKRYPVANMADIQLHAAVITAEEFTPAQPAPAISFGTTLCHRGKLVVTTAYVLHFIANCKPGGTKQTGTLKPQELYHAKIKWINSCRLQVYGKEISCLMSTSQRSKQMTLL